MTREEKLDWLYRLKSEIFVYMPKEWLIPMADALDDAIKALEQEPTTKNDLGVDCIDRKALLNRLNDFNEWCKDGRLSGSIFAVDVIKDMPSVTSQDEPFKPMVEIDLYSVIKQKYIEREVLDKIRAEIEKLRLPFFGQPVRKYVVDECLEIIDKYKADRSEEV